MQWKEVTTADLLWNMLVLLTVALIAAKLTDTIEWSWWLVLSPMLVPIGFMWAIFIALFIFWFSMEAFWKVRDYFKDLT